MRLLTRTLFREIFASAVLGSVLFTSVLFLERARPLFESLVRTSGPAQTVLYLFLLVLPQALPFAIPLGVLLGTLIALSRMSSDGEITAMRAAGVSGRRVLPAVMAFAVLAAAAGASTTLWLTPWAIEERIRVQNKLIESQLTAEVTPRVFDERFPDTVLHVRDADPGPTTRWKRVLLADVSPSPERGDVPLFTLATEAVAAPDFANSRIQVKLSKGTTYTVTNDFAKYEVQSFAEVSQTLNVQRPPAVRPSKQSVEMRIGPLYRAAYGDSSIDERERLEARLEFQQRLALPAACLVMALTGIALGVGRRRSGKSSAGALTVALAFAYYVGLVSVVGLAEEGKLAPEIAVWLPNAVFALMGVALLVRLERPAGRDFAGPLKGIAERIRRIRAPRWGDGFRIPLLPQVIDTYLTSNFLFYFVLWLASFVLLTHVFTFFELLGDIVKNQIPLSRVAAYLFLLTPRLIYASAPAAALTSVLVVFGLLARNNEATAFKACGVSVYRLIVPVFLTSLFLAGSLFAFNHYVVPQADRRQDAIRAEIKGRPPQTFAPGRKWIYGMGDRVFYYKYYDPAANVMGAVNVFEIDASTFRLARHVFAERARWEPAIGEWVFQNGWSREFQGDTAGKLDNFSGQARTFVEIEETPDYFVKEAIESEQMNYLELRGYIDELQQSGFDTVALQVQFYKKFSVPLFTVILAMLSAPFAFTVGRRGAMAGIGASLAIYIAYSSIGQLFEQVGNLSQLPPVVAAWSPDAVFSLAALYFLSRVRT